MANLYWVTPTGSVADLLAGVSVSVDILAADTNHNNATISYSVIGGALPTGLTLSSHGTISGVPAVDTITNYATSTVYKFIIRAVSANGYVLDGSFSINLSNVVNNDFSWITPAGDLGSVPDGQYYSLQIQAETSSNLAITYSLISGEIPYGMRFLSTGYLQGVPTFLNPLAVDQSQTFRFSVRATSSAGHVIDQSFSLSITNVYGPVIEPTVSNLGTFFDGTLYTQQLTVNELNPAGLKYIDCV